MEDLTIDLAKKIIHQQHAIIADMRDLELRHFKLHREIQDVLSRDGSISADAYINLFSKALDGWKPTATEVG